MFDLVIRNGTLVDGTGAPRRRADVALTDGKIAAIGDVGRSAHRVVDAEGMVVAPGFVDIHTHYDPHVFWDPHVTPSSLHGVTTVVGGNCGFTLAPIDAEAARYLLPMLARVEAMPLASLEQTLDLTWSSFAEFLGALDDKVAINVGFLAGHSSIRRVVMGGDAVGRTSTADEEARMVALLEESLAGGALGFSSSWGTSHTDHHGDPVPSRWATEQELLALCGGVRDHPGTVLEFIPPRSQFFDDATTGLLTGMSLAGGRAINWNLLRVRAEEESLRSLASRLDASDRAAAAGARVVPLTLPEPFRLMTNFSGGGIYDILPDWSDVMALPLADRVRAFADPAVRARLAAGAASARTEIWTDWPALRVAAVGSPSLARHVGRTVAEIAGDSAQEPFDALLDLLVADGALTVFESPVLDDDDESWARRAEVMRDPRVVVGGSDAGAHLDMLTTFALHTRLLEQMVRTRGLATLEEAVHLVTDVPARFYGLRGRGRLAEGWQADIVVFDPDTVGPGVTEARTDLPAGGLRLFSRPTGVAHVLANGVEVACDGEATDDLGGTVLRSGRDTVTVPLAGAPA